MERHREVAAAPIRSATDAWKVVSTLLTDTLERSEAIPAGSVEKGLAPLLRLGPALIAGGHLEAKGLVLVDEGLHVTITIKTADAALAVEENLSPVPGGTGATEGWKLYVPACGPLDGAIATACKDAAHLSADDPPKSAPSKKQVAKNGASPIDVDALRKLRGQL